jgi:CO/xanthine dehydrogenase FAD-binding subunit
VKPAPFRYAAPDSLAGALELLEDEDALPLAGGQSLVPLLNFRLARPSLLVDLGGVAELRGVDRVGDRLVIGAMTRQTELLRSGVAATGWPLIGEALAHVGHAAIRNRGTVGGSVAHADPAAELPVALSALDARMRVSSAAGERVVEVADFFRGPMMTALRPGELLVGIDVPLAPGAARMAFAEHARTHGDFAIAGVAIVQAPGQHAAIALLGGGLGPVRATAAERALLDGAAPAEVAALAATCAAGDHRRALIGALTTRALDRVTT